MVFVGTSASAVSRVGCLQKHSPFLGAFLFLCDYLLDGVSVRMRHPPRPIPGANAGGKTQPAGADLGSAPLA
jgi:hypothetical protein